jgi:hypothetical protein
LSFVYKALDYLHRKAASVVLRSSQTEPNLLLFISNFHLTSLSRHIFAAVITKDQQQQQRRSGGWAVTAAAAAEEDKITNV